MRILEMEVYGRSMEEAKVRGVYNQGNLSCNHVVSYFRAGNTMSLFYSFAVVTLHFQHNSVADEYESLLKNL